MKQTYTINLDKEAVEELKEILRSKGMTFSGFINTLIHENIEALRICDGIMDTQDLTLGHLQKLYVGMVHGFEKMREEEKKKKG